LPGGTGLYDDSDKIMAELPTGSVTFLFTDVEGSTRLLRALGDGYRAVQDRHAEIMRAAIGEEQGHEVRTGSGEFERLSGQGWMVAGFEEGDPVGRETFTGSVTR
jgi:class 3 adenylate cyclase